MAGEVWCLIGAVCLVIVLGVAALIYAAVRQWD